MNYPINRTYFTVVKSKSMIQKIEDHKIFEIKITRSQKKNDPKNEDHKNSQIKIMRSQSKTRSKSHDHDQNDPESNYFHFSDHKIKLFSCPRS